MSPAQQPRCAGDTFAREREEVRVVEVLLEFSEPVVAKDGRAYIARACGGEMDHPSWQGWLEFLPVDGGEPVLSSRETTQPNLQDTAYWATGLTPIYLEGALDRALNPLVKAPHRPSTSPAFQAPAPDIDAAPAARDSVLNPFSVYRKGETHLRRQLSALSAWHLVNIIAAYELSEQRAVDLTATEAPVLVELIVAAVRQRDWVGSVK
jgi:hypothetical protein